MFYFSFLLQQNKIFYYDNKNNKLIQCLIFSTSPDVLLYSWWFTSPTEFTLILYEDISYPENAAFISKGELKSPDLLVETHIKNNTTIGTFTWHRVKK